MPQDHPSHASVPSPGPSPSAQPEVSPVAPEAAALLSWYDRCARILPWRGIHDPYRTWVSEIMLQQTRVDTVIPYYERFLARFPTLSSLAEAPEEDVLKLWEGLGYYSRARNLRRGAVQVMQRFGGRIPSDPAQLTSISGIGTYTAGAIASIAFDLPVPAVDGNVIRVLSRLDGLREDVTLPAVRARLEARAAALVPPHRPGDYNQAVMDLGATVCVPGTPDCDLCPLAAFCNARACGDAPDLPLLPRARPPRLIHYQVLLLRSGSRLLLRRRTEAMLQGLWVFPLLESADPLTSAVVLKKWHLAVSDPVFVGPARHVFTHQIWQMQLFSAQADPEAAAPAGCEFVPFSRVSSLPFPAAMKAALSSARSLWPDLP